MKTNTLKASFKNKSNRMAFLILFSLLLSGNALSRQHWKRSYFDVVKVNNTLEIAFEVFDYHFGPANENGFLQFLSCEFSSDGVYFFHFMNISTDDQRYVDNWTWVNMQKKLAGTKILFRNCFIPPAGTRWAEDTDYRVEFDNFAGGSTAWFSVIWCLEQDYYDIKYLRISGTWMVNGAYKGEKIKEVYEIDEINTTDFTSEQVEPSQSQKIIQQLVNQQENNVVRVSKQAGQIVVKGAETGQTINVYTTTGALIKTIITTNDDIKIKLPTNQMYILNIGQARYKVAL